MSNFTKTQKILSEAKINKKVLLKKTLQSSDFGYTNSGGNGFVKSKGSNLVVYDSYFYNGDKALKSLIKSWSKGGGDYEYFTDNPDFDMKIKVVKSGSEVFSKMFDGNGAVWVELEVK